MSVNKLHGLTVCRKFENTSRRIPCIGLLVSMLFMQSNVLNGLETIVTDESKTHMLNPLTHILDPPNCIDDALNNKTSVDNPVVKQVLLTLVVKQHPKYKPTVYYNPSVDVEPIFGN
jgi:hypothetical protein